MILVGTSGWSYPSGKGTWNGVFYPPKGRRPRGFNELAFYAAHFDTVEVNSTFYRPPSPDSARRWAKLTPDRFEFSVKLYQKFTHPEMFHKATGQDPHELGTKDVDEFRAGIAPLAESGKLGALLAQFPASFKADENAREYLAWLRSSRPAPGFDRVRIAGEPEREYRAQREREGIPVDDETWKEIRDAATKLKLSPEKIDALARGQA